MSQIYTTDSYLVQKDQIILEKRFSEAQILPKPRRRQKQGYRVLRAVERDRIKWNQNWIGFLQNRGRAMITDI